MQCCLLSGTGLWGLECRAHYYQEGVRAMVSLKQIGQITVVMTVIGTLAAGQPLALAQEPNQAEIPTSPQIGRAHV